MAIEFDCPTCRTRIRTPDEAAGKKARCPTCQSIVPIPLASTAEPSQPGFGSSSFGSVGSAPLPSASSSPPPNPFAGTGPVNPPPAPMPWLPPSDAFAPKGPPEFGGGVPLPNYAPAPPKSGNPFSDTTGSYPGAPINPYASPSGFGGMEGYGLSRDEIRAKLLGPAIGIAIGAVLGILGVAWFAIMLLLDDGFHRDLQAGGDPAATFFAYLFLAVLGFIFIVPCIVSLVGAWAMFRGRGLIAAWSGAIATLLPCAPCWLPFAAFAIWGMVVLNDPRVQQGMK